MRKTNGTATTYYGAEYDLAELESRYGRVSDVYLIQHAYLDMDSRGKAMYVAQGVDGAGNMYYVKWKIVNSDCDDEADACDWNKPQSVEIYENVA